MENKKCISYGLEHKTGVIVSHCYQCGKCTAGCVLAEEMDFPPSLLVRLLQTKTYNVFTTDYYSIFCK